jgi:hypothetical protein
MEGCELRMIHELLDLKNVCINYQSISCSCGKRVESDIGDYGGVGEEGTGV